MIINAIRYRHDPKSEFQVWRLLPGQGRLRNFQVFSDNPSTLNDLHAALHYVLTGANGDRICEAAIQFSDDSGDSWMIEKKPENTRYFRNGKELQSSGIGQTLLAALLDLDYLDDSTQLNDTHIIKALNLHSVDGKLSLSHKTKTTESKNAAIAKTKQDAIQKQISELFPTFDTLSKQSLCEIKEKLCPLFYSYREVLRQRRTILASKDVIDRIDPTTIEKLENELKLIHEIEEIAKPILDPAKSNKIMSEKLLKIERELNDGLKKCNIKTLPINEEQLPWVKLAETLAQLEAYEKSIAASDRLIKNHQKKLFDTHQEQLRAVRQLLDSSTQITTELESCLSKINLHIDQVNREKNQKKSLSTMIAKFIKPSEAHSQIEDRKENESLETSRMAVDYALTQLGKLHSSLSENEVSFEEWQSSIELQLEQLVSNYGKLKKMWSMFAEKYNLPSEMTLKELTRLIIEYNRLDYLWQRRNHYRQKLSERKSDLTHLEQVVRDYQTLTQSQKDQNFSNQSILIAEAQSILRYKSKKETHLRKLKANLEQTRTHQILRSNIDARINQLLAQWREVFRFFSLSEIKISDAKWPEFFEFIEKLKAWQKIEKEETVPVQTSNLFSRETSDSPLTVISIKQALSPDLQSELFDLLERHSIGGLVVLLVTDLNITKEIIKRGAGRSHRIAQKKSQMTSPAKQGGSKDDRAEAILQLLNKGKPASKPQI